MAPRLQQQSSRKSSGVSDVLISVEKLGKKKKQFRDSMAAFSFLRQVFPKLGVNYPPMGHLTHLWGSRLEHGLNFVTIELKVKK